MVLPGDDVFGIACAVRDHVEEHQGVEMGRFLAPSQEKNLAYLKMN